MLRGSDNYACVPWLPACISPVGRALRTQQKVSRKLAPAMEHGANPSACDVVWRGVFGSKCTHRPIRINTSWDSQHAKSLAPTSLFPLPWPTFRGPRMGLDAWGLACRRAETAPRVARGRSGLREGRVFVGHPTAIQPQTRQQLTRPLSATEPGVEGVSGSTVPGRVAGVTSPSRVRSPRESSPARCLSHVVTACVSYVLGARHRPCASAPNRPFHIPGRLIVLD